MLPLRASMSSHTPPACSSLAGVHPSSKDTRRLGTSVAARQEQNLWAIDERHASIYIVRRVWERL